MAKIIIGIHGLSNKPPKEQQRQQWIDSIAEGLRVNCGIANPVVPFDDVYWADLLYKVPQHDDPLFSFDSLYDDEPYSEAKRGTLIRYEDGWMDRVRADAGAAVGAVADRAKKTLGLDAVADLLLARILKDLEFYYNTEREIGDRSRQPREAKLVLQDELSSKLLQHKTDDIMLIGHSMGSIIAYDVLRNLGNPDQGVRVSHFVTIGSPLGLPTVKRRVAEERGGDHQVRTPTIVTGSWVNFADRRDPVAFDTHLKDDYQANGAGIRVRDELILNDYHAPKGKANYHKLFGYLRAPEVSDHIRDFLA